MNTAPNAKAGLLTDRDVNDFDIALDAGALLIGKKPGKYEPRGEPSAGLEGFRGKA